MDISTSSGLSVLEPSDTYEDPGLEPLSYDETVPYEEQFPTTTAAELASRIGNTKVYLLSESSAASAAKSRGGKRKRGGETEGLTSTVQAEDDEDIEMDTANIKYSHPDPNLRPNALLLQGTPISHLPTARLFAYATHFIPSSSSSSHPLALEWISDTTCVLVFSSRSAAQSAFRALTKSRGEEPDNEGFITSKPIPMALWPPEDRINRSLGLSDNAQDGRQSPMKGLMKLRWARIDDVKKRGAMNDSEFYKKHGKMAGKEMFNGRDLPVPQNKRRRVGRDSDGLSLGEESEDRKRERLDQDLDAFLAEGEAEDAFVLDDRDRDRDRDSIRAQSPSPPSPPSKMRSDYIASDGRTVVGTPDTDAPKLDLASRLSAPWPRRSRQNQIQRGRGGEQSSGDRLWSDEKVDLSERITFERTTRTGRNDRRRGRRDGNKERENRPKKSQQELDDELDAFLREE
ncbi:hypothetical protein F5890DRAFT_1573604 [Lentinula detonsa]|uniref:Chromatin target of PRMT1 protein C-terminal domain-containing protein n=1 Tax=Lentinula detonsa TaxID=2804962 RepID=A0AA38PYW0_9AGAR|nr:hypothetical protein F5890DRAFT_1573604 [Lentinula detonsa]